MKQSNSTLAIILGFLVVAVIGLGVVLMNRSGESGSPAQGTSTPPPALSSNQTPVTPTPSPAPAPEPEVVYPPKETVASMATVEELNGIIAKVGDKPTADDIKQYSISLGKVLVDSPNLDVTGCTATPNVLHLRLGQTITVSNGDDITHQVNYGQTNLDVPAKSQRSNSFTFSSPGNYPFRCDQSRDFAGVFVVTP